MLLDGAVKFAKIARQALEDKDVKKSHENLVKVQDIFIELMVTIDRGAGKWAEDMFMVYEFIKEELTVINLNKDVEKMDTIIPLIEEVRNIWNEAYSISKRR